MKRTTISIPDKLVDKVRHKVEEEGFLSMNDYVVSLIREDTKGISLPQPLPAYQNVVPQFINPDFPAQPMIKPILPLSTPLTQETITPDAPTRIPSAPPPQPLHPKTPPRDPNAPDPYLTYGGKCQFKNVSADNIMCLQTASKKIYVAQNQTGDRPSEESFTEAYLCPDHIGHVSHSSGFFIK